MIAQDAFEEHAKFGGNYYGSSRQAVEDVAKGKGKSIDGSPAEEKSRLDPRICFIQPPDLKVLEERLRGRGDTSEDAIKKRLQQAKNEIEYCRTEGRGDKVIVNDDLERTFKEMDEWVMKDISTNN